MEQSKSWIAWSTGKDCSFALMKTLQNKQIDVCGLLSTVTKDMDRVSMHGTRRTLLEMQARSLGIALHIVEIPENSTMEIYENQMQAAMDQAKQENIHSIIFGDLFLENVRAYREEKLSPTGIQPSFPLWNYGTSTLAQDLIHSGVKAIITCIDSKKLPPSFVGRTYDQSFLNDLPSDVDPCGEHGEFHTFVYDAPIFSFPIGYRLGEVVQKGDFYYIDVLPIDSGVT